MPQQAQVPLQRTRQFAAVLVAATALLLLGRLMLPDTASDRRPVALFTSLPIMWAERDDLSGVLATETRHRVRASLERMGPVIALDTLENLGPAVSRLVIAQPRPLSPAENVALDNWVRKGGQLVLFADPLLTEESSYQLGDPRRPQGTVLLSPILARWGLELTFDDLQPAGLRAVAVNGPAIPVNQAGAWQSRSAECQLEGEGLLAVCQVGNGQVMAVADAEILSARDEQRLRDPALANLLDRAFDKH